eukprot:357798-Chlamydomonas_euryale.AAC.9
MPCPNQLQSCLHPHTRMLAPDDAIYVAPGQAGCPRIHTRMPLPPTPEPAAPTPGPRWSPPGALGQRPR